MPKDLIDEFAPRRVPFFLVPRQWQNYPDNAAFDWQTIYFDPMNRNAVPTRPGVYYFSLQPRIARGLCAAYVLYIGKAEASIRQRYNDYLRKVDSDQVRPRIARMLRYWYGENCLYFSFSILEEDDPAVTEQELLAALVPPMNTRLPSDVHAPVAALT